MAYEGEILDRCPQGLDFSVTQAVVVSGASWNPCGHMILCLGTDSKSATYFHVAGQGLGEAYGIYAYPKFMIGDENFNRYLNDNGKKKFGGLMQKLLIRQTLIKN